MAKKDKTAETAETAVDDIDDGPDGAVSARETVTVASKWPTGLWLQLFRMEKSHEPMMGGGHREIQKAVRDGVPIRVNGPAVVFGAPPPYPVICGFALTHNVPREHWERWRDANKDSDLVRNGLISAYATRDNAEAYARDNAKTLSGMEPVDPSRPPPGLRGVKVEKFDGRPEA